MIESRTLLIVAHVPSDNTQRLRDAIEAGAVSALAEYVKLVVRTPFEANADDVLAAKALVLGTKDAIRKARSFDEFAKGNGAGGCVF